MLLSQVHFSTDHRTPTYACTKPANPVPKILISGAPASGKGTQCELLVQHYDIVHISTGDMLRAAVKEQTPLGMKAKSYMDTGKLVPDEIVISMLKDRIKQNDAREKGWLLDGFPRTAVQAQALDDGNVLPDAVIVLEVPDDVLIDRVVGRRLDPVTGKIYHVKYSPPRDHEVEARLQRRSDDTEEKASTRLNTYYTHSKAILDHYRKKVRKVNGNRDKQDILNDLIEIIDSSDAPIESDDPEEPPSTGTEESFESSIPSTQSMSSNPGSSKGLSVAEFVQRAEEAYERGVLETQDVNWSGQAALDYGSSGGTSSYADLSRRLDLVFGDALMILTFTYIGRSFHGSHAIDATLFKTAAPFLVSWFLITPLLGCYTRAATANVKSTIQSFARSWALAVPMGIALRGKMGFLILILVYAPFIIY